MKEYIHTFNLFLKWFGRINPMLKQERKTKYLKQKQKNKR